MKKKGQIKPLSSNHAAIHNFTLVELLVVVGIIGLLIALLMPALWYARRTAKMTECQSNMKQVTAAFLGHASGKNGRLPAEFTGKVDTIDASGNASGFSWDRAGWIDDLAEEMGFRETSNKRFQRFMICPADEEVVRQFQKDDARSYAPCKGKGAGEKMAFQEGLYGPLISTKAVIGRVYYRYPTYRLQNVFSPRATFMLFEFHQPGVKFAGSQTRALTLTEPANAGKYSLEALGGGKMHGKGQNYTFCDGHLEWLRWQPDINLCKVSKE